MGMQSGLAVVGDNGVNQRCDGSFIIGVGQRVSGTVTNEGVRIILKLGRDGVNNQGDATLLVPRR